MFYTKSYELKLEPKGFNNILYGRIFPESYSIENVGTRTNNP